MKTHQKIYMPFKRLFGLLGSIVGILLCAVLIWWWVIPINAIATKGHPFFVHKRIGKHKKVFPMLKFRSMKMDADPNIPPWDLDPEVQKAMETKFGAFLRRSSIDETPQLLNIFVGQMAFIGPRPGAAVNEEELVILRESYKPDAFEVRPGMGGYAQLTMNRVHDPKEKARLDHEYVRDISLLLDFKIFVLTLFSVFGNGKGR